MSPQKPPDESQIAQALRLFRDQNPNASNDELFTHVINLWGPAEPKELLEEANEPSLDRDFPPGFEAYRIEHRGNRVVPNRIIRFERDAAGCRFVTKVRDASADGECWAWNEVRSGSISQGDFDAFAQSLDCAGFWDAAHWASPDAGFNPTSLIITGRRGDRYHAVHRLTALPEELDEVCRLAERLAGLSSSES